MLFILCVLNYIDWIMFLVVLLLFRMCCIRCSSVGCLWISSLVRVEVLVDMVVDMVMIGW